MPKALIVKPINQELSPGDIIGVAFNLLRRNIVFTCKVLMVPTIINALGSIALQWTISKPVEMTQSLAGMGSLVAIGSAGLVVGLIAKWILTIRQMALMRIAGGFSSEWEEAYKFVLDRKWQVVALWILTGIVSVALFVGWVLQFYFAYKQFGGRPDEMVPSFLLSICLLLLALFFVCFAGLMSLCIIACDTLTFKDTVDKTVKLLSANFLRCFGFSAAFVFVIMVLSYPLSMPIALLGIWDTYKLGIGHRADEIPIHTVIVGHVWESFITLLISPLFSYAFATFYVDVLNRKEGLDLRRRLETLSPAQKDL